MRGTKDKDDSGPDATLRKDFDYQRIYLEGYLLLFREASAQGLLAEAEDLADMMYAYFPSKHKAKIKVFNAEMTAMLPVHSEWKLAKTIGPPPGSEEMDTDRKLKVLVRDRVIRKAQIISDIAEYLKLLGEEFDVSEMGEDSDVLKELNANG
jgi:hypothetical protein